MLLKDYIIYFANYNLINLHYDGNTVFVGLSYEVDKKWLDKIVIPFCTTATRNGTIHIFCKDL